MPYKDPERKKEWEQLHRAERLARRRELRRIEASRAETPRQLRKGEAGNSALRIPATASEATAAHNSGLGIAAGGLALVSSAVVKKAWIWWLAGCVILVVALLFYWRNRQVTKTKSTKTT
jgi:hypothetical protein